MRISDWSSDVCSSDLPVGADSVATLELEGLTGGRYVELTGGGPTAPPLEQPPGRDRAEIQPGHSSFEQVLVGAPEMLENVNLLLLRTQALLRDRNLDRKSTRLNTSN